MKNKLTIAFCIIFFWVCSSSCKKDEPPSPQSPQVTLASEIRTTYSGLYHSGFKGNVSADSYGGGESINKKIGICWGTEANPTIQNDRKIFDFNVTTGDITGLIPQTKYYVRAFVTNEVGTAYGNQVEIVTPILQDVNGNRYPIVKIGNQVWMKENLNTRNFRDGQAISNAQSDDYWKSAYEPAWAHYENFTPYSGIGKLYNYYAVEDSRLCPAGWRVPSDADWDTLVHYLGGEEVAGGKLKDTSQLWRAPNYSASNSSGFSGRPAGFRYSFGMFALAGLGSFWWARNNYLGCNSSWSVSYDLSKILRSHDCSTSDFNVDHSGLSVRCILDKNN